MATIFYALSGEGRGHATRASAVIDELRVEHSVKVYAYHQAYDLLRPRYRETNVEIRQVDGMTFSYTNGGLDYWRTLLGAIPYLAKLPSLVERLCRDIERDGPALAITDFEPLLPRAAKRMGVPFVSLDHQHFLLAYDLSALPLRLRWYARALAPAVQLYYRGQLRTIVSSFYFPPLNPRYAGATRVGVLLRPEVRAARPEVGEHAVAYVRRHLPAQVLKALSECGRQVRVYGMGARPSTGNLRFCEIDARRFVEDLATSRALISTAGNQLIGEALYLDKPVLALPEVGNYEQQINGHFLAASGAGEMCDPRTLDARRVRGFIAREDEFRARIDPSSVCGNASTLSVLHHLLDHPPFASSQPRLSRPSAKPLGAR